MRNFVLMAGTALIALSAPVIAQGHGRGHDRGGGQAAERAQKGGQHGAQHRDRADRADRGQPGARRGNSGRRAEARDAQGPQQVRPDRQPAQAQEVRQARQERGRLRAIGRESESRQAARQERVESRGEERHAARHASREDRRDWRRFVTTSAAGILPEDRSRGRRVGAGAPVVIGARNGCPPGLAKQNAYCLPPGQLRHLQNAAYNVPVRYRYRFVDGGDHFYRYADNGLIYRYDRDDGLVDRVYPLYASGLLVGTPMPLGYEVYNVPIAYRPYYQDSGDWLYRYDDGAIYRVDEDSGMIDSIVALLTGGMGGLGGLGGLGALGIGDSLPAGYDVYNVPFDYRDDYADSDDAWYRYADGSIYQVDPQTQLIEQVISLIA